MYTEEIISVLEEHVLPEQPVVIGRLEVWVVLLQIELNGLLDLLLIHEVFSGKAKVEYC